MASNMQCRLALARQRIKLRLLAVQKLQNSELACFRCKMVRRVPLSILMINLLIYALFIIN